jgi:hypothetical protein
MSLLLLCVPSLLGKRVHRDVPYYRLLYGCLFTQLLLGNGSTYHNMYLETVSETLHFYFIFMLSTSLDINQSLITEVLSMMIEIVGVSEMLSFILYCLLEKTVFHLISMRTCDFRFPFSIFDTNMITDGTNYSDIVVYILNCKKFKYLLILWSLILYL